MGLKSKRIAAVLSAGAMFATLIAPQSIVAAESGSSIVSISTADEFLEFSENCTLDSWSKGKTVTLNADINLAYSEFTPIPIFGGTFNGNGHSVTGLKITAEGSDMGLFRYVEKGGKVENLIVMGIVAPEGTQNSIGGIAGENYGTIKNCTFNGSVTGEKNVGGIVGHNAESGRVISCGSSGTVRGKTGTGGIAGDNSGTLIKCENNAGINLTQSDIDMNPSDIDVDKILGGDDNEEENILNSTSDTGGVVGYSDGIVQSCVNNGNVGYPHVGYNTGGIAGRQSGYLSGCTNNGNINGRKEVGGIVGQTEPYLSITPSEDLLGDLQTELDKLNVMVDDALDDAKDMSNTTSAHLSNIKNCTDNAQSSAQSISNSMEDFVNDNIDGVNMLTADISNAIDLAKPAADDFADVGDEVSEIAELLSDVVDILKDVSDMADAASKDVEASIDDLQDCADDISDIAQQIRDALDQLQTSVIEDDAQAFQDAVEALKRAIEASEGALNDIADALGDIESILDWIEDIGIKIPSSSSPNSSGQNVPNISLPDVSQPDISFPEISVPDVGESDVSFPETSVPDVGESNVSLPEISRPDISLPKFSFTSDIEVSRTALSSGNDDQSDIDALVSALKDCAEALGKIADSLPIIKEDLDNANDKMDGALDSAENAADSLNNALASLREAVDDIQPANDSVKNALDILGTVADRASYAGRLCTHAFGCVSDAIDSLANINKNPFKPLSGNVRRDSDDLFDTLSKMFDEAEALNTDFNDETNALADKLKEINGQIKVIADLVIDEINTLTDSTVSDRKDYIQDTSEEDITATREGKVSDCRNNGSVDGDRNIGGIAGAMAIEYDLDPEDDVTDRLSVRARYETKSVLQGCVNYGKVTAKKDGAGGLAGRMDLGTAINSQSYGEIIGTDYVGGAVGYADASVRNCYTKSRLSGVSYIGGIAGYANRLSGCYAITTIIDGDEFMGAIAGGVKEAGTLKDNCFIDTGIAGVDGISYSNRAEPITFQKLSGVKDMPIDMLSFNIVLNADDKLVKKIPFTYGQDLSKIALPQIPEKDDNYGVWPDFDKSGKRSDIVLDAVYSHIVTITQSEAADGKLALALASGTFTDDAELCVEEQDTDKPIGAGKDARIYHLTLKNTGVGENDVVSIRILNPGKNKASVWMLSDGKWESVTADQSGKYMLAEMTGTEATFCIATPDMVWIPFAAVGGAAVVVLIVVLCTRKAKKRKKEKSTVNNK